jgi:hypothetical protein
MRFARRSCFECKTGNFARRSPDLSSKRDVIAVVFGLAIRRLSYAPFLWLCAVLASAITDDDHSRAEPFMRRVATEERGPVMADKGTNVQLGRVDLAYLERRGARSHRGGSDFSRSSVLSRELRLLADILEDADPRLPTKMYDVAVELLREGWRLKPIEVRHLDEVLAAAEGFSEVVAGAGLNGQDFLAKIAELPLVAKYSLLDRAIQMHAPAAAEAAAGGHEPAPEG